MDPVEYNRAWLKANPEARDRYRDRLRADCALYLLKSSRIRAGRSGWDHNLTPTWVRERVGPMRCEVTGIPLRWVPDRKYDLLAPSIDRIDPADGYWMYNCRVVSWGLNALRGVHSDVDLQEWLTAVRA